ncbi:MAG: hypothetical protein BHV81_13465 [Butyricimonas synergistica]|nr:MAG: hypothetical protein BHV81_13465 [Butyricimonas synergistica]
MKKILMIICFACLLLEACDKAEVPSIYSGPDGINFYYDQVGPYDADPYPDASAKGSVSALKTTDTLYFRVDILGNLSTEIRKFALKQTTEFTEVDVSDYYVGKEVPVAGVNYIAFDDSEMEKYYEVAPDSSYVVFPVIMKYDPAKAGKKTDFLLIFELLPTEELPIMDPRFYRAMLYFTQEN